MASASVEDELQCPICMELLSDPVTLDCGHNYCRDCISQYFEKWKDLGDLECPLCKIKIKKQNFRSNWQLANIAEKIKSLLLNQGKQDLCVKHLERLHLFCKEDDEFVCLFCERSPEHRSHTILLLEEAAEEYKVKFKDHLRILVNEQERILKLKISAKSESQDLLKKVKTERKRAVTEFRQLQEFLQKQENCLLAQMDEVEEQIVASRDNHLARLSEELSSLESLIQEMQGKLQQPTGELLKSVGSTLQKYKTRTTFENPEAFLDMIECRCWGFSYINSLMANEMKEFKATISKIQDPVLAHYKFLLPQGHKNMRQAKNYRLFFSKRCPPYSELQQPSREDTVRREENTRGRLNRKEKSGSIRIYGSQSDPEDLS